MAMSQDDIYKKVQHILVDALGVDEEEVTPKAAIREDLGAESIDFLDIAFRLEKEFPAMGKIDVANMTMPEGMQSDPNLVKDGKLTDTGLTELKNRMPYADYSEFEKNPQFEDISRLFTVGMLLRFVEAKLAAT